MKILDKITFSTHQLKAAGPWLNKPIKMSKLKDKTTIFFSYQAEIQECNSGLKA